MKTLFLILVYFVGMVIGTTVFGQSASGLVTDAALEFNTAEETDDIAGYERALNKAKQALAKSDGLKPKQIAKANSVVAKANLKLLVASLSNEKHKALATKYPNMVIEADDALQIVAKLDDKDAFEEVLKRYNVILFQGLLLKASESLSTNPEVALGFLNRSERLGARLGGTPYNVYIFKGEALANLKTENSLDSAIVYFEKSIKVYDKQLVEFEKELKKPGSMLPKEKFDQVKNDKTIPLVIQKIIRAYTIKEDASNALKWVDEGKKRYPNDDKITEAELNVYRSPKLFDKAFAKFEEQIKKNPKDTTSLVVLADLYEKRADSRSKPADTLQKYALQVEADLKTSLEYYQKALALNPKMFAANYNVGALLNNSAQKIDQKINNLPLDDTTVPELEKQKEALLTEAIKYFKAAHAIKPNSKEAIKALYSLCVAVGLPEAQTYKALLDKMDSDGTNY